MLPWVAEPGVVPYEGTISNASGGFIMTFDTDLQTFDYEQYVIVHDETYPQDFLFIQLI